MVDIELLNGVRGNCEYVESGETSLDYQTLEVLLFPSIPSSIDIVYLDDLSMTLSCLHTHTFLVNSQSSMDSISDIHYENVHT